MTDSSCVYVDCRAMGFALKCPSEREAPLKLKAALAKLPNRVLKTHDLPSKDFDTVVKSNPELRLLTVHRDFKDVFVSRFFYYRYYWPSDETLGPLPNHLQEFYAPIPSISDRQAIHKLLDSPILANWAQEWAAFEGMFETPRAIRLTFEQLASGGLPPVKQLLGEFTGLEWKGIASFASRQAGETYATGRTGNARFNREGRRGQYFDWFNSVQIRTLDAAADTALCNAQHTPE